MKKLMIGLILLTAIGCRKETRKSDILYQDFGQGKRLELVTPYASRSEMMDVNLDGHPDYFFNFQKYPADGIYHRTNAFYLSVERSNLYLQQRNPFEPVVLNDTTTQVQAKNSIILYRMAKLYQIGNEVDLHMNNLQKAYLIKEDEIDTVRLLGEHYLPVVMAKNSDVHYGWIRLNLEPYALTLKGIAFCTTANKKIRMGER